RLAEGRAAVEYQAGQDVDGEPGAVVFGGLVGAVAEDVEVEAESAGVDSDLADDAVFGERTHHPAVRVLDGPDEPTVAHAVVPVPGVDGDRRAAVGRGVADGRALRLLLPESAEDLRTGVERGDLMWRQAGAAGDAVDLGGQVGGQRANVLQGRLAPLSDVLR